MNHRPRQNKSVLITGCSSGIGAAVAHGLSQRVGYRVIASARRQEDVEQLRQIGLEAVRLDLDDPDSVDQAVEQTLDLTGGELYGLFNNGAYGQPGAVEDLSRETLRRQFETNLFGWHQLTCRVLPLMRRQGYGRIIQNSSVLGFVAMPFRGAYNASKYALEGLTDTLRLELRGSNIHISLIEPGPIASRFRENGYRQWQLHIDTEHSVHADAYRRLEQRLVSQGPVAPFTLPASALLKPVTHALESRRPRIRYRVTTPTHAFALLKRLLPDRALDYLLNRAGGSGKR